VNPADCIVCPVTHETLRRVGDRLVTASGRHSYPVSASGIPLFAEQPASEDSRRQQSHYDHIASAYLENLSYPHTEEYSRYLDGILRDTVGSGSLGLAAEICCGRGEAMGLFKEHIIAGTGVDISLSMLEAAQTGLGSQAMRFVQGDAVALPLQSDSFDHVFMLGGIHHVNDRRALFGEVFRILKPGGRFIFREPLSDFFVWRWLRAVIYRLSPALDAQTERPLRHAETVPLLQEAGLRPEAWRTCGFLGAALLLNSDVLVFNRFFRFLPGIRGLARAMARLDDWAVSLPFLRHAGLQVVGAAVKPPRGR
jgi:ubiquinone/menaquinone biosynthesis C-methylase UbiE